jgi:hypothetical protein
MPNNLAAFPRLVAARAAEKVVTKWWEKETPNMRSIDGIQELVDALVSGVPRSRTALAETPAETPLKQQLALLLPIIRCAQCGDCLLLCLGMRLPRNRLQVSGPPATACLLPTGRCWRRPGHS